MWKRLVNVTMTWGVEAIFAFYNWYSGNFKQILTSTPFPSQPVRSGNLWSNNMLCISIWLDTLPDEGVQPVRMLNVTLWLMWQNTRGQTLSHYPESIVYTKRQNELHGRSCKLFFYSSLGWYISGTLRKQFPTLLYDSFCLLVHNYGLEPKRLYFRGLIRKIWSDWDLVW